MVRKTMGNVISLKSDKDSFSMSNQGTDCFLELLEKAASGRDMTENQRKLIDFLKARREINQIAPGSASFDIVEMPWNKETLQEDTAYMMRTIKEAKSETVLKKLDYRPDIRIVFPWLDRFAGMIWTLDKNYIYGDEERETVKAGIDSIRAVMRGGDSNAKRRLLFYLDQYTDPYYGNDLTALSGPLKELLKETAASDNEKDIIEEALYLLEADF